MAALSNQLRALAEQAFQLSGSDIASEARALCKLPARRLSSALPDASPIVFFAPTQVFDDLYYVGSTYVGATIVKTSDGLVLVDSLTNDAADQLVAGMKTLGLNPAQIRYAIITHGHGDHYGGLKYLRAHYPNFPIVASEDDLAYMTKPSLMPDRSPDPSPKEQRGSSDIGYVGSHDLIVGDTYAFGKRPLVWRN